MELIIIFFILPAILLVLFVAFLISYLHNKRKSKHFLGRVEEEKTDKYKSLVRVFGIVGVVMFALAVGATVLLFYAVEHM